MCRHFGVLRSVGQSMLSRAISGGGESGFPRGSRRQSLARRLPIGGAMAGAYSLDLRVRVVEAVNEGATRHEASERLGVSISSAIRWHRACATRAGARPNPAAEAVRRWMTMPRRLSRLSRSSVTGHWMRSWRRCTSGRYPAAARRCIVFWSVTA